MFQALARSPPKSVVLSTDVNIDDEKTHSVTGWFSICFQLRGVSPEASDPLVRLGSIGKVRGGGCTEVMKLCVTTFAPVLA